LDEKTKGQKAFLRGDFSGASERLGAWCDGNPGDGPAQALLALALFEDGRTSRAQAAGEKAEGLLPPGHPALLHWALALCELGESDRALGIAGKVLETDPKNPLAWGIRGLDALKAGRPGEALGLLRCHGVFQGPLFRAHLLVEVEEALGRVESGKEWGEGYLLTVL
jgi:tetratricopeptide (TPR) repeat protein